MTFSFTIILCGTVALTTVLFGRWLALFKPLGSLQFQLTSMAYRNLLFLILSLLFLGNSNFEKDEKMNIFLIYFFCYLGLILVDTMLFIRSLKRN